MRHPFISAVTALAGTASLVTVSLASTVGPGAVRDSCPAKQSDIDSGKMLAYLAEKALNNSKTYVTGNCAADKIQLRPEYRTLSIEQRLSFVEAVKCVRAKPSLYAPGAVPGSTSLFEDFVAVHLNHTLEIHLTGTFLTWHRYYTYIYELAIQECGYKGALPYWEWPRDVDAPEKSPVFDGSPTSMGGNGAYVPHDGMILGTAGDGNGVIPLKAGTGGGCVTTGPFGNLTTGLGPCMLPVYGQANTTSVADPLGDNRRCLRRDLSADTAQRFTSWRNCTDLITQNDNIEWFQGIMQGDPRYIAHSLGVHGGGHYTIGGDPGSDAYISPGDPAFYLHHSMIDRMYWIWQNQDFPHRQDVWGTNTFFNNPPSANTTVDDIIDLWPLVDKATVRIKDVMNTVGGTPLCYAYI